MPKRTGVVVRLKPKPFQIFRGWALLDYPKDLPVVFRTREDAESNAEPSEQLYRVEVHVLKRVTKRQRPYEGIP